MRQVFVLIFFPLFAINSFGQSVPDTSSSKLPIKAKLGLIPKLSLTLPASIFYKAIDFYISLEKEILEHESVQLGYEYLYSNGMNKYTNTIGYVSVLIPEFKYYFKKHSQSGFYAGADMQYILSENPYNDNTSIFPYGTKLAGGLDLGGRIVYKKLVFDCLFGFDTDILTSLYKPFIRGELNIGYEF